VIPAANVRNIYRWFRQFHVHNCKRAIHDVRYGQIAEPLVIRGNDKPQRMLRAGFVGTLLLKILDRSPLMSDYGHCFAISDKDKGPHDEDLTATH
jgi:hypothetical protein